MKIKMLVSVVPGESPVPCLQIAAALLCFHMAESMRVRIREERERESEQQAHVLVFLPLFIKILTPSWGQGPTSVEHHAEGQGFHI